MLCFYYENLPTLLFDLHWSTPRDVFPTCFERSNIKTWFNRLRFELYRGYVFKTLRNQYGLRIYSMWMYSNSYPVSEVSIQTHLSVGVNYSVLPQPVQEMHFNLIHNSPSQNIWEAKVILAWISWALVICYGCQLKITILTQFHLYLTPLKETIN